MKTDKYVCKKCGKEYKVERYYLQHIKKCDGLEGPEILNSLEVLDETIESLEDLEQEIVLEIVETPHIELMKFMEGLGSRISANKSDIEKMSNWYKWLYPQSKVSYDWRCKSCVQHLHKRLKEYYDKHK